MELPIFVTAEQMIELDRRSQSEFFIPQILLMENAGKAVADEIALDLGTLRDKKIAVVSGKGNNGGDGFVAAKWLHYYRYGHISVYSPQESCPKDGSLGLNARILGRLGMRIMPYNALCDSDLSFDVIVDAIFGTGFRGVPNGQYDKVIKYINSSNSRVFSVDIPSGLHPDTGEAIGECVRAYKTVTFGLPKRGFYRAEGPLHCGRIVVSNPGFPPELLDEFRSDRACRQ
ncbi:MAG: NAD(P)H-hydrate epimerase [Candidatus Omnitrophica bacterium]|nr:NAD(P)H-hydrate epimerase [Candidatus Omnitrophota bacterium]